MVTCCVFFEVRTEFLNYSEELRLKRVVLLRKDNIRSAYENYFPSSEASFPILI
jgi:hypothetical protein